MLLGVVLYLGWLQNYHEQGLVAQWTRARGYGPRCRGFESLLARLKTNIIARSVANTVI